MLGVVGTLLASMLFLTIFDFFLVVSPEIEPIVQDI
jgi:hypothetical protein